MVNLVRDLQRAARAISQAKALIITAGSGLGVDSGLQTFTRNPDQFWKSYPALKNMGIQLAGMNNPKWFERDPEFAWGFFGHRINLFRNTKPSKSYAILKEWASSMPKGYFVFTSNVDGHFGSAGFEDNHIAECYGNINFLQCVRPKECETIWALPPEMEFHIQEHILRMKPPLPIGPPGETHLARPNILMFGDAKWVSTRTQEQEIRFESYVQSLLDDKTPFVVVEVGAGVSVPTVRMTSEHLVDPSHTREGTLIRINLREPFVPQADNIISLPMKAFDALARISEILDRN